jgi:hypothetical protein
MPPENKLRDANGPELPFKLIEAKGRKQAGPASSGRNIRVTTLKFSDILDLRLRRENI